MKVIVRLMSDLVAAFRTILRILYFVDPATLPSHSIHPGKFGGSPILFGWHYTLLPSGEDRFLKKNL